MKFTWKIQTLKPGAACPCNEGGAKTLNLQVRLSIQARLGVQLSLFLRQELRLICRDCAQAQPTLQPWLPTPTVCPTKRGHFPQLVKG